MPETSRPGREEDSAGRASRRAHPSPGGCHCHPHRNAAVQGRPSMITTHQRTRPRRRTHPVTRSRESIPLLVARVTEPEYTHSHSSPTGSVTPVTIWDDVVTGVAIFACLGLSGLMLAATDRSISRLSRRLSNSASASPRMGAPSTLTSTGRGSALNTVKPIRLDTYYDLAIATIPQRIVDEVERSLGSSATSEAQSVASLPTYIYKGARAPELGHKITKKPRM